MKRLSFAFALFALVLSACAPLEKTATLTGRVTDEDGLPVRDARVWTTDGETRTSANGAYVLSGNRDDFVTVFAEYTNGGTVFKGRNVGRAVANQIQTSINITIAASSRLAHIRGRVRDNSGFPIVGASVFAFMDGNFSSGRAVTDSNGNYELRDLIGGITYDISAGAYSYSNDEGTLTLSNGETRTINFTLIDAGLPTLPAPANLSARAWTSPRLTRGTRDSEAYENIKRLFDKDRAAKASTRSSSRGEPIEVQLDWDRLSGEDFYGYGIYRGLGDTGNINDYDFYREPLAGSYLDGDPSMLPGSTYRYQITALGTLFPDDPDSEGPRSSIVTARTLNDLIQNPVTPTSGTWRFSWQGGSGATSYVVYVFNQFPGLGVSSVWNNEGSPTSSLFLDYGGPTPPPGQTYYVMVLGLANGNTSRTISGLQTFFQ